MRRETPTAPAWTKAPRAFDGHDITVDLAVDPNPLNRFGAVSSSLPAAHEVITEVTVHFANRFYENTATGLAD